MRNRYKLRIPSILGAIISQNGKLGDEIVEKNKHKKKDIQSYTE